MVSGAIIIIIINQISKLESVQRRFTKQIAGLRDVERLKKM